MQLAEFINDIALSFDKGVHLDAIFLGFKKAFGIVPHHLYKSSLLGIPESLLLWLKDSDRLSGTA